MANHDNGGKRRPKKGAKGGVKHTPGRGHTGKSDVKKKKRFQKKAEKKRKSAIDNLQKQWELWDSLTPEAQRLRPDLKPNQPRPKDES